MSTIIASNISDGTTSVASTYVVNGSAKAWVNFNGTSTVAIRDSLNVGSITDNGTGNYTVNISSAMSNANYAGVNGSAGYFDGGDFPIGCGSTQSQTGSTINIKYITHTGSGYDSISCPVAINGDLA